MMPGYRHMEPYITANDGSPMMNPLRDWRVRKALSLAINREAIRDRIMGGASLPTRNIVPPGFFGYVEDLEADAYDPDAAKALLAEAGYGDGFRMTIHGPNDRYINDARIIEAVAQFWTQIGITTEVDTMPRNIFFSDLIRGGADRFPGFDSPEVLDVADRLGHRGGRGDLYRVGHPRNLQRGDGRRERQLRPLFQPLDRRASVLAKQTIDRDARLAFCRTPPAWGWRITRSSRSTSR
jgi:peptide/nickel transport system substrate-binding protein